MIASICEFLLSKRQRIAINHNKIMFYGKFFSLSNSSLSQKTTKDCSYRFYFLLERNYLRSETKTKTSSFVLRSAN